MRYHALACDYDGTIAWNGRVDADTIAELQRARESGRKLLLVTGRELDDLAKVFPRFDIFDLMVIENGAVLYHPATREKKLLAEAPPREFSERLIASGAERVSVGDVIVATWEPWETVALELIREMGLELQVIFNKGAVMILPSGVNKAFGLLHALSELALSPHNVVGVGDAENDHAFLSLCECSVAVSNALDTVKQRVNWVTERSHGGGVQELVQMLLDSDLAAASERIDDKIVVGKTVAGKDVALRAYGTNVLITGSTGSGKSTLATVLMEGLAERHYQFLIVDPEGDYSTFEDAVILGDEHRPPSVQEVLDVLSKVSESAAINLVGLALKERPEFFKTLLARIQELRATTGRPHWLLVDEAHHVLPSSWKSADLILSKEICGTVLVTLEPNRLNASVLSAIDVVFATGEQPQEMLRMFADAVGEQPPALGNEPLQTGEVLAWFRRHSDRLERFLTNKPKAERLRHSNAHRRDQQTTDSRRDRTPIYSRRLTD
jgi:HAD superfamily hydrolase (TIGR01484 family)